MPAKFNYPQILQFQKRLTPIVSSMSLFGNNQKFAFNRASAKSCVTNSVSKNQLSCVSNRYEAYFQAIKELILCNIKVKCLAKASKN